ncbi:uncharacterized protein LOC110035991 isoform X2 [Phalaenopsis equestris]|uniref:uncharacterized protein LOC110035991 isoform X2 n=1 Tax=Phalaenopsis equestris TaxID=78828 RepID=UPI0009E62564|nr:uncharacterized protein LOC110035991 isoform X2 [Phalaenopsis equestris]
MAAVASAADQATELLQKLSMESKNKTHEGHEVSKKYGSSNGVEAPKAQMPLSERSVTPVLPEYVDPNICYLPNGYPSTAYYYGAYDGSVNEWDYSRYAEGVEVPHGVYGDMYHHGYGYAPYAAYHHSSGSPIPSLGHESHIYGAQHYPYLSPYTQPQAAMNGTYSSNNSSPPTDINSAAMGDKPPVTVEPIKSNGNKEYVPLKQSPQNSPLTSNGMYSRGFSVGGLPSSGYQDPRFGYDGVRSPVPWFDGPTLSDPYARSATPNAVSSATPHNINLESPRNQNAHSFPQLMGLNATRPTTGHGIMNRMYPANQIYGQCGNSYRSGFGFGSNLYDSHLNDRWGMSSFDGKYKPRGRGNGFYSYGNENFDGLSELSRGPRANRSKNYKSPLSNVTLATKGQPLPTNESIVDPNREQYNRADFSDMYSEAKFFVIKSYSEDDIHRSIKYNVWASTPNGNKKLDAAYKEAKEKGVECPVFLFFSVNTSGQFVGVAEMVGPVDFDKTVDYWQQDKWNGCFDVKWHIVNDVPNNILKHITIESNDNKPVTNSRDTQEVKLEQGVQMLKIFKEHVSKTSILDDFSFYESRQKMMQERRSRQQQLVRPMVEVKPANPVQEKGEDASNASSSSHTSSEPVQVLKKEVVSVCQSEQKQCGDNCLPPAVGDAPKGTKPPVMVVEKRIVSNGAAN